MECVEGALKGSFRPEMVVKATQQVVLDDLWAVNGQTGVLGDDFFVDDLLDFSNGGIEDGFVEEEEEEGRGQQNRGYSLSVLPSKPDPQVEKENGFDPSRSSFSVKDYLGSVPGGELSVPVRPRLSLTSDFLSPEQFFGACVEKKEGLLQADDLANLEWLSHFVEDSFSEYSLTFPAGKLPEKTNVNRSEPEITVSKKPCFTTPLQTKARSKRARTGGRVWSLGSPLTETSSSSSTSSSSTSSSSLSNHWLIYSGPSQTAESLMGIPTFNSQKKPAAESSGGAGRPVQPPRRCSHCHVQKTPQWRNGPLGPKTLCNACGVRYKSGRLLPEYRPACSPTFSSDIHSNNHRKVLEMRRKKESGPGLSPPVQNLIS